MTMSIMQADAKASKRVLCQPSHVWRIQIKSQFVMNNLGTLAECEADVNKTIMS